MVSKINEFDAFQITRLHFNHRWSNQPRSLVLTAVTLTFDLDAMTFIHKFKVSVSETHLLMSNMSSAIAEIARVFLVNPDHDIFENPILDANNIDFMVQRRYGALVWTQ